MERRKYARLRLWLEIAGGVAGIALAVFTWMGWHMAVSRQNLEDQHTAIVEEVGKESLARQNADDALRQMVEQNTANIDKLVQLNQDQLKVLTTVSTEMHIVMNRLHLDGSNP